MDCKKIMKIMTDMWFDDYIWRLCIYLANFLVSYNWTVIGLI